MNLQTRLIIALKGRGFAVVEHASRKAVVLNKPGTGIFIWVGPNGACRANYAMKRKDGARPISEKVRANLLALPIVSDFYGANAYGPE